MTSPIGDWLSLIRGEISEMPGLRFSLTDAQQRWNVDDPIALQAILDAFCISGVLTCEDDGQYVARSRRSEF